MVKLKVPTIKKWNCDPTAEIIIQNLEKKIDILSYENFLLTKNIKELFNNNRQLQINMNQNLLLMKNQQTNEENLKIKKNKIKNENDIDLYKEMAKLREENIKLKKDNQIVSEENVQLKIIIEELNNNKKLNEIKFNEELEKYKNLLINSNKVKNSNYNLNENNIIDNEINNKTKNLNFDINKYILNDGQCKELLNENEKLHLKLKNLLSITDDEITKCSFSLPKNNIENINLENHQITDYNTIENNINNLHIINNSNNISYEELIKENILLKEKIKDLNEEINKINIKQNIKLIEIQEKLNEYETKKIIDFNINKNNNDSNNTNEELDNLLNEALLLNVNEEDEETKNMILTIQNMKDYNKKRISQCLIINNRLKLLIQENNFLHKQLFKSKKEDNNIININDNQEKHICIENDNNISYDYLINLLKIKDEIIQKYKDREEEKELKNKELIIENNGLIESYNNLNKDYNTNNIKSKRGLCFEDYFDKIVHNQKEVLGERAPRFKNSEEFLENNKSQRYNNYFQNKNKRSFNEE